MDLMEATIQYLGAQPEISDLVSTRIFGAGLPPEESVSMPRKAITLNESGGPNLNDLTDLRRQRFDFFCYGETPYEAGKVAGVVRLALQRLRREVWAGVLLDSAIEGSGDVYLKDQDGRWPLKLQSWLVLGRTTVPLN